MKLVDLGHLYSKTNAVGRIQRLNLLKPNYLGTFKNWILVKILLYFLKYLIQ